MSNKFNNTKWDVSSWTKEMKIQWQEHMLTLGYTWADIQGVSHLDVDYLDVDFYYLNDLELRFGEIRSLFYGNSSIEKVWEDVFPTVTESKIEKSDRDFSYGDSCVAIYGTNKGKILTWLCRDPREGKAGMCVVMDELTGDIFKVLSVQIRKPLTPAEKEAKLVKEMEALLARESSEYIAKKLVDKGLILGDLL